MTQPEYLSVAAVARRWQVSPQSVRRLIDAGELPAVRLAPKCLRVQRSAVAAYEAEKAVTS